MKKFVISTFIVFILSTAGVAQSFPIPEKRQNFNCEADLIIEYIKSGVETSIFNDEGNERIWLKITN